jgi:hypothetical protein
MSETNSLSGLIKDHLAPEAYREQTWEGSWGAYLALVEKNPTVIRNAYQRIYDMILTYGYREVSRFKEKILHYNFFEDPLDGGRDAVFGLDEALMRLVGIFKSAAHSYGTERRVLLLHGPVGSAKSTIVRLLKKGLEVYSKTPEGALYTYAWESLEEPGVWLACPMREEPLKLIPRPARDRVVEALNAKWDRSYRLTVEGEICPFCRKFYTDYMARNDGDWEKVTSHLRTMRLVLSEKDRVGIGTFQPKDEKNQDSTELTGDINYRKIAVYGSDSDPRAFNFDGEFNVANRGLVEFVEVLKLDVAFLYDLLGASQEHTIKPKKFAQTDIDEVIIGHTRHPVQHGVERRGQDLPEGLSPGAGSGEAYRAAHHRDGGHVGGSYAARGAEEGEPDPRAEAEVVQRKDASRIHGGQHFGAAAGGEAGGDDGDLAALYPGQDLERAGGGREHHVHESLHGPECAGEGVVPPLPHHERRDADPVPRDPDPRQAGIRGHRQE